MSQLPLRNIRVLEITHIIAGPTAGLILADMGADVIKVEPPDALDPGRAGTARNGSFFFLNHNKRSIVLDLKKEEAKAIFYRLADKADVVLENMGPGVMDRLGVGYDDLAQRTPRIIYCSLKGFLRGPFSDTPLMDEPAQMMSGLAYMTGPLGRPLRAGSSVVDMGAANYAIIGVLGALLERQTTGKGQHITGGLFETALFYIGQHMAQAQFSGEPPRPMPERDRYRAGGYIAYDLFDCADGRQVFLAIFSTVQWQRFCQVVGLDDLAFQLDLQDNGGRGRARPWALPLMEGAIRKFDSKTLIQRLTENGVAISAVNTPETVLEEPQVRAPHRLFGIAAGAKNLTVPALPYESSSYEFSVTRDAPNRPGRDTREVLTEAGYTKSEIDDFYKQEVAKTL